MLLLINKDRHMVYISLSHAPVYCYDSRISRIFTEISHTSRNHIQPSCIKIRFPATAVTSFSICFLLSIF